MWRRQAVPYGQVAPRTLLASLVLLGASSVPDLSTDAIFRSDECLARTPSSVIAVTAPPPPPRRALL